MEESIDFCNTYIYKKIYRVINYIDKKKYLFINSNRITLPIINKLKIKPSEMIRKNEAEFKDNNIANHINDDDKLIKSMIKYPKIIERPIIIIGDKAVIGRPPENILSITE